LREKKELMKDVIGNFYQVQSSFVANMTTMKIVYSAGRMIIEYQSMCLPNRTWNFSKFHSYTYYARVALLALEAGLGLVGHLVGRCVVELLCVGRLRNQVCGVEDAQRGLEHATFDDVLLLFVLEIKPDGGLASNLNWWFR